MSKVFLTKKLDKLISKFNSKLEEYNKSLNMSIQANSDSNDFENMAKTCIGYAIVLSKLESEIEVLEDMLSELEFDKEV